MSSSIALIGFYLTIESYVSQLQGYYSFTKREPVIKIPLRVCPDTYLSQTHVYFSLNLNCPYHLIII